MPLETKFNTRTLEKEIYETWERKGYFQPDPEKKNTPYCIVIPPPNVTGNLHMGHGFQQTLMDILIRYHRMLGDKTLWMVGTDHASIAVQMLVERQLIKEGKTRESVGRQAFLDRAWEWKQDFGNKITQQMRRLGISVDWTRERFTMDDPFVESTLTAFERLYDEGLIYQGKRLVNWDPYLKTAVSDLEVVHLESEGQLVYIRYHFLNDPEKYLTLATTRPETLFGDSAVAVHPDDERYKKYIGQPLKLPLTDRIIPIIADSQVDSAFGTGCVKITPAHDFNDYQMGIRHHLPLRTIFTPEACLNDEVPLHYRGLERFEARKKVIADLTEQGLIEKIAAHKMTVPHNERGNTILEPRLTEQWYLKTKDLAQHAINAVESGSLHFSPESWTKIYLQWLEHIEDWCISRQLWWGHQLPVFYDKDHHIYVAVNESAARQKYKLNPSIKLTQETDVLDTWFSAALWPFATLGWPQSTLDLKNFYPTDVLVTGFDIIFFWVARMVMLGLHFTGQAPFKMVYITGLVRDEQGQKMSKTKGNVLDPIDLVDGITLEQLVQKRTEGAKPELKRKIEKWTRTQFPEGISPNGTDALRFTYCALATPGRDIRFDIGRLEGYRNFCNKLWNAARFAMMHVPLKITVFPFSEYEIVERWILSRLQQTIQSVTQYFSEYRFDLAAHSLYDFLWHDYCDNYLEFSKTSLYFPSMNDAKWKTQMVLLSTLEVSLRLLHPIMPFITEKLWQTIKEKFDIKKESIMIADYPVYDPQQIDQRALNSIEFIKKIIASLRALRSENTIDPRKPIDCFLRAPSDGKALIEEHQTLIQSMAKLETIYWLKAEERPPSRAASGLAGDIEIFIPLQNLLDPKLEKARLKKSIQKREQEIQQSEAKLNNMAYLAKAPAEIVEKEKEKLKKNQNELEKLSMQLTALGI